MTTRKSKQQLQLPQVVHLSSDHESDINYLSDIPPPSSNRSDEELNLAVLKRHEPTIVTLEHVAPYAVVYVFASSSQQWVKSGIEGSAFVCGLAPTPEFPHRYSVIVLNRRGLDNFRADLSRTTDVEVTEEYIILQSSKEGTPQVYGLWVFCEPPPSSTSHQREATAHKIQECAARAEASKNLVEDPHLGAQDTEAEESVPMTRQLSLKEIFEQRRQQDDSWSVRNHSPKRAASQFVPSADTEFLRSSRRHAQPRSHAAPFKTDNQHQETLLGLFRQASEQHEQTT